MEKPNTLHRFASWLVAGEGKQIEKWKGSPINPKFADIWYTPEWLHHCAGNAALIGFYMPTIAFYVFLATR